MRSIVVPVLVVILAFYGCATTQESAPAAAGFTLDEILGRMPPRDSLEARWLGSALLSLGPAAIQELCKDLDAAGSDRKARAEFALQNVALSVSKPGAERERLRYVSALDGALERHPSDRAASFILAQLQLTGRGESVAPASRFLNDPHLCEPAAQAMVAIREGADGAFLLALPDAGKECRITIIQSLGVLRSSRAVDALRHEAASEDSGIRRAALEALANIEASGAGSDSASAAARGRAAAAGAGSPSGAGVEVSTPARVLGPESADSIGAIAKTATGPEQLAAIRTLGAIGGEGAQKELIEIAGNSADEGVVNAAQKSLATICLRQPEPEKRADVLLEAYGRGNRELRLALLPAIGRVGGSRALKLTASELRSADPDLREAAVRALSDWPSVAAYDTLLAVAKGKEKAALRILAMRGCVRMVEQAGLTPTEAVRYHERTLAAAWRVEEKRLVIGALANIRTPYALKVVAPYVKDDSLGLDAALAAGKISAGIGGTGNDRGSSQTARAFIDAYVPAKYRDQADRALDLSPDMNDAPQGFRTLFNGKNLEGWKGLVENPGARSKMTPEQLAAAQARADSSMRAHWSVADGVVIFDGKGESLCTAEDFEDFELLVDWKIERFGDSGIYLRGSPQVQIWDPVQWPEGSGGLYNNQKNPSKPLRCADNPIGEWNTFRITMIGDRVTVALNGVVVVDSVVLENYWDRSIPIFPSGQIELQSHSSPLAFRNIYIREIPRKKPLFSGSLFNGSDLSGWTVVGGKRESWGASNDVLFTNGENGGWLSTDREYDNFELELDFRLGEGGNSGVFIRAPREGDPAYTGMEIQVLDDYAEEYTTLKPWQYCGSVYGVVAAERGASKKASEWQHYRIVARGPKVTVTLNGRQIVDADLIAHMDQESTHPGLKRRSGFIGLQCHGDRVEYRNITLKELEWSENHDGN
jgi:HEAT repeat protein